MTEQLKTESKAYFLYYYNIVFLETVCKIRWSGKILEKIYDRKLQMGQPTMDQTENTLAHLQQPKVLTRTS